MARKKRETVRKEIRESLLMQLRGKGAFTPFYFDLVEKYMDLWDDVEVMREDIRDRGMRYEATSASGKVYEKPNENLDRIPRHLKEMESLLDRMKLSPDSVILEDGQDDDAL